MEDNITHLDFQWSNTFYKRRGTIGFSLFLPIIVEMVRLFRLFDHTSQGGPHVNNEEDVSIFRQVKCFETPDDGGQVGSDWDFFSIDVCAFGTSANNQQ